MMIDNKIITIKENNTFDKGWALFERYSFKHCNNFNHFNQYKSSNEIIPYISTAKSIYLFLYEKCLPKLILDELQWVNKYIDIHIIASSQKILNNYNSLKFKTTQIDEDININYIAILGKENHYYFIANGIIESDNSVYDLIVNKQCNNSLTIDFNNVNEIYIFDDKNKDFTSILNDAVKNKIAINYITSIGNYKQSVYEKYKNHNIFVSNIKQNVIIINDKNNKLFQLMTYKSYSIYLPFGDMYDFVGDIYKCLKHNKKTFPKGTNLYVCYNGEMERLNIKDNININTVVNLEQFEDFYNENFDKSIVNKHNDYSLVAQKCTYNFTLIPPLFDKQKYGISSIYNEVYSLYDEWGKVQSFDIINFKNDILTVDEDNKLINFLNEILQLNENIFPKIFSKYCFHNFNSIVDKYCNLFDYFINDLMPICSEIYEKLFKELLTQKFVYIDNEISNYEKIILDKEKEIKENKNILANKHRIEDLKSKISELNKIKQNNLQQDSQYNLKIQAFNKDCESNQNNDFIDNKVSIVLQKNTSPQDEQFKSIIKHSLYNFKKYLLNCHHILTKFKRVELPEDYVVYEKDGQNYIVIDALEDFIQSKNIRKKFNLQCLVRR